MRLTCPNCGAQYEVARDAVPPEGRDVQCSNCGVTWLAMPEPATEPKGTVSPSAPRSTITPEIAEILRAEAEREAAARRRDGTAGAPPATAQPSQPGASPFEEDDDDTEIDFTPDDGGLNRGAGAGRRLESREIWDEEEDDGDFDWAGFAAAQSATPNAPAPEAEAAEPAGPSREAEAQGEGVGEEAALDEPGEVSAPDEPPMEAAQPDTTDVPEDVRPGEDEDAFGGPDMEMGGAAPREPDPEDEDPFAPALDDDMSDTAFDEGKLESHPASTDHEPENEAAPFAAVDGPDDDDTEIEQDPFLHDEPEEFTEPGLPAEEVDDLDADAPPLDHPAEDRGTQRLAALAADEQPDDDRIDSAHVDEEPVETTQPDWPAPSRPAVTGSDDLDETEEDDPFGRAMAEAARSGKGRAVAPRDEEPEDDPFESAPYDNDTVDGTRTEGQDALKPAVTEREAFDPAEEDDPFARVLAEVAEDASDRPLDARDEASEGDPFAEAASTSQDDPFAAETEASIGDDPDDARHRPEESDAQDEWEDPHAAARQRATLAAASTGAVTRRDLLPDIEEINSSLRSTSMRGGPARPVEAEDVQRGRGFRLGFGVALLLAAALALVYSHAERIGMALPPLAPALDAYAGAVDAMRIGLDNWLRGLIDALG
ncbi:zinc-ribbon domain-containing protein [Limimaricola sp. AA108-03]|uniref:zinc-ribbon domain-containing protein n=1 Tax=Limimaricola sp. AA108-03 TaxID=3425945 RepID=UPI003D782034